MCIHNFSEIAFIGFTLHEIKRGIVFFGTPSTIRQSVCCTDNEQFMFINLKAVL